MNNVFEALYKTYCYCEENDLVDNFDNERLMLAPIYHEYYKAKKGTFEIRLSKEASLIGVADITDDYTVHPGIQNPRARSGLMKELVPVISGQVDKIIKNDEAKTALENWISYNEEIGEDEKVLEFLKIIQKFLKKEDVLESICKKRYGDNFTEKDKKKIKCITFEIQGFEGYKDRSISNYKELHKNYIKYISNELDKEKKKFCSISGKKMYCHTSFPGVTKERTKKLMSISSKTPNNWEGRIKEENVFSIGVETGYKIIYMLNYFLSNENNNRLIERTEKGESKTESYFIGWFSGDIFNTNNKNIDFGADDDYDDSELSDLETIKFPGEEKEINRNQQNKFFIMYLYIHPKGRATIKYFNSMRESELDARMILWYKELEVEGYNIGERKKTFYRPGLLKIINYTFGKEKEDKNKWRIIYENKKHIGDLLESLNINAVEGKKIPRNIVKKMYNNVCHRQSYKNRWNDLVLVAYSIFKKYYLDYEKLEVRDMKEDRNYLYGRLLAVLEKMEEEAFYESGVERNTNAQRFWSAYTRQPAKTMQLIIEKINPYRLKIKNLESFEKLKSEIIGKLSKIENIEESRNDKLNEIFIFGYYNQRQELFIKKDAENQKENN